MPLHDHRCIFCGAVEERQIAVADLDKIQWHDCMLNVRGQMLRVFLRAPMGFVQKDICYDSPIDGRPITNMAARRDDLARSGCIEWDPGVKQDQARKRAAEDAALDKSVDATVDEFFATAGTRKLEKLESELRGGADAELTRRTPDAAELT